MAEEQIQECPKCPECPPAGLPGWMGTFADMVTLLLTFFVLLLSFAKTETAKYEAALGSIRNAFGGNVLKHGEVIQRGKSANNSPNMMESEDIIRPFPIEFLTMEGLLDKHEVNRNSDESLLIMRQLLVDYNMLEMVYIEEIPEGIIVRLKDPILFNEGTTTISKITVESYQRMINLISKEDWTIFVEGHASRGEKAGSMDAMGLSSLRSMVVTQNLISRGIKPDKITSVFYGDTRPAETDPKLRNANQRVDFLIRKRDLKTAGRKVPNQATTR